MKNLKRTLCLILILSLCLGICAPSAGAGYSGADLKSAVNGAARWIVNKVSDPSSGDYFWTVFSVARSGYQAEESWYRSYLKGIRDELDANGGALKASYYTKYSTAVLAYTALGQQPPEELLRPLSNFEKVCSQGINGPLWALIALDSGGYKVLADPTAETVATRQMYVDEILSHYTNPMDASILTIADAPWPGFTPDLISIALVTAIQAKGSVLIHQKMFESRLFFVDMLQSMGAQIVLCDPHRAIVVGLAREKRLRATKMSSPDIRAGIALLIAALSADGTSVIQNVEQIDRGYEHIVERLNALGAKIERL